MKETQHFGSTLGRLMELNGITGAQIRKDTAIAEATISVWKNGRQLYIEPSDMQKLARVVAKNDEEKAQLIAAWIKDFKERCGEGSELIAIDIKRGKEAYRFEESPLSYATKLPPSDQAVLNRLAEKMAKSRVIAKAVKSFTDAFGA